MSLDKSKQIRLFDYWSCFQDCLTCTKFYNTDKCDYKYVKALKTEIEDAIEIKKARRKLNDLELCYLKEFLNTEYGGD
ncbi:MAG: hypothetical protein ACOCRO_02535 [Halanaerobiales bacterium]